MKDLGETTYILKINIYRDRSTRLLGPLQFTYIGKMLKRFNIDQSKRGFLLISHRVSPYISTCPMTQDERDRISKILYASAIGFYHVYYIIYYTQYVIYFECHEQISN